MRTLTDIEHVLRRPGMYVGAGPGETEAQEFLVYNDKCVYTKWNTNQILQKIFEETIDNAVDNAKCSKYQTYIRMTVEESQFIIENDGVQILVSDTTDLGVNSIEAAFGVLRSSSRFDTSDECIGMNGLGVKLCNIFSCHFTVEFCDRKSEAIAIHWSENMRAKNYSDSPDIEPMCIRITCVPDRNAIGKFVSLTDYIPWIARRFSESSILLQDVCFQLNDQCIENMTIQKYIHMHTETQQEIIEIADGVFAMLRDNMIDGDTLLTFCNGHRTPDNGIHSDSLFRALSNGKKPASFGRMLRDNAFVYFDAKVQDPVYNGQAKHKLIGGKINPIKIKTSQEAQAFLTELREHADLQNILKTKISRKHSVKVDKLHDALQAGGKRSSECTLFLTEGDSAKTMAMSGLSVIGHDLFGVYPLRGKALNVRDASKERIMANTEWSNVMKILGVTLGTDGALAVPTMRYGKIVILADADLDGIHIAALVLNFFAALFPKLLSDGLLKMFRTPVVKVKHGTEVKEYFTMRDFTEEEIPTNAKIHYYKGLGSSSREEARAYFSRYDELVRSVTYDTIEDRTMIDTLFSKDKADDRKGLIQKHLANPAKVHTSQFVSTSDFIRAELLAFSAHDIIRSIPNAIDGLKVSHRKIIHIARNAGEIKVAQLAATVALKTMYLHGEGSLSECATGLAQDFIGSNNNPLLKGIGQFGSRLMGGKDAASPRYIHVLPSNFLKQTLLKVDDELLHYLIEENVKIEPAFFVPLVPYVLINGTRGIATGFSTYVPNHRLADVVQAIRQILNAEEPSPLLPHWNNFNGTLEHGDDRCTMIGKAQVRGDKIHISELPVYVWTDAYLQKLRDNKDIGKVISRCDDLKIDIEVKAASRQALEKTLCTTIYTKNMYLLDRNNELRKFKTTLEILKYFVEIRLEFYEKRKSILLQKLDERCKENMNLLMFLELLLKNSDETSHIKEFMNSPVEFLSAHSLPETLLRTNVSDLSVKKIDKLKKELEALKKEISDQADQSPTQMYLNDLSNINID